MPETIYGAKGPYLTRYPLTPKTRWGQLCLHVFHREDEDEDPHDHARDFLTIPLSSSYTEETYDPETGVLAFETVRRFKLHRRKAEHCHRIVMSWNAETVKGVPYTRHMKVWPLVTLVWFFPARREWGFWVKKDHPRSNWVSRAPGPESSAVWKGRAEKRGWLFWEAYCYPERYADK